MADKERASGQGLGAPQSGLKAATRSQGGHMADKVWRRDMRGDTDKVWRCVDCRQHGGHMADKGLEARPKRTQGGHTADTSQTSSGDAARAYRGQPFFF